METAKPTINYRYAEFDLDLALHGECKLSLTVIDAASRAQFYQKEIILQNIGVNTLMKALDKTKQEIQVQFSRKLVSENQCLEIKVSVDSPFLKPVQELILLKKIRDVSQEETLKKSLDHLSKRVKQLKESNEKNNMTTFYGGVLQQKNYTNGATYEPIASIKLPKGKFLITLNFLCKATNQWIYLYFNQGQVLMQNSGFYMPSTSHYIPHTVRKMHTVFQQSEVVLFTTYCCNSYPISVRNAIVTAKPLAQ